MNEKETLKCEDIAEDNLYDMEMAYTALDELLNQYEWAYDPDARKAIEHSNAVGGSKDEVAQFSYKYITDYRKIMWLIRIARDYCYSTLERCENIYRGGASNE